MIKFLKIFIKRLYRETVIKIFYFIYGKPKLLKNKIKDNSVNEYKIVLGGNKYQIFKFDYGTIFTNSNDTTAYISKNNYLSDASMQFYKFDHINSLNGPISKNETLFNGTPKIKKKIKGNILSLLSGGAAKDNFTHWFTDIIPRIKIFSTKFQLSEIDKYYVPSIKYKFQIESLKYFGIKQNQLISSEKFKHIQGKCIYATSHPCHFLPTKVKKWSIDFLNKKFSKKIYKDKYKKIFIDRDQFKLIDLNNLEKYKDLRVLINENEIKNYLKSEGFDIIKPEEYSFKDQVKIFSSTKFVIGLYGAAMMMLSFCKKNTRVLEIKPKLGGNEFKNISKLKNLKHRQINLKPVVMSSIPQNGLLLCPIKKIQNEMNNLL
tara:strand:- start:277 stop:1401 length:1125 start_codon:yes stop_codon:yes gene_type:complete